ncbi:MAG TPA: STAS domain-containing protein [Thermoanaerobaculia bacterium]|nr:STAS domain-containing protein [Thermoanaerobaculia bacterium]
MLKIEKTAETAGRVTYFLSGRISDEQVSELEKIVRDSRREGRQVVLDLEGVGIVDRRAVRFFLEGEGSKTKLLHTPVYVAEWLRTESGGRRRPK